MTELNRVISNEDLKIKLNNNSDFVILDVRQEEEYEEKHIPNVTLIPLNELSTRYTELEADKDIYVICESGGRSDLAMNFLISKGFDKVYNVVPGMSEWYKDQ